MVAKLLEFGQTTFSAMRKRNFRLYFLGQAISLTGGWMQNVAQSWLVLHLTGSAAALGIIAALQYGPSLFLGPYAGVIADRMPKRRLLAVTQAVLGLLALALGVAVLANVARPWMVFLMAGLLGIVQAVDYPTRQSFLYELTGPGELVSAVGLSGTANNLARVAGPAIAGALIATAGMAVCFLLNAVSFVAVLVCLAMMRPTEFHRATKSAAGGEPKREGLAEGLRYASSTPQVREALAMMAIVGVLTYEFSITLPAFVKFGLHMNASALAYLMSSMGLGAAIGGIITAGRKGDGLGHLSWSAAAFGLTAAAVGLAPTLSTATVAMFFVGVFSARFVGLSNGILQLKSAPAMRNRVMALWSTGFLGSTFFGGPLLGWLAQVAGSRASLLVGALGGLAAAAIGWRGARQMAATGAVAAGANGEAVADRSAA